MGQVRHWDDNLDFVRFMAAVLVVVVHVFANAVAHNPVAFYGDLLASAGILIFIILSGCTNSLAYRHKRRLPKYTQLWRRAATRLFIPYLLWTLIYRGASLASHGQTPTSFVLWHNLGWHLFTGDGWFHLYFMVLLIYLYIAFGASFRAVRFYPRTTVVIFALSPILTTWLIQIGHIKGALNSFLFLLPTSWWGILFIIGIFWARHAQPVQWVQRKKRQGILSVLVVGYFGFYSWVATQLSHNSQWYIPDMILRSIYAFLIFLSLYIIGQHLIHRWPATKAWWHYLAGRAYTLYFCHPLVILIFDQYNAQGQLLNTHQVGPLLLELLGVLVVSLLLSSCIDGVVRQFLKIKLAKKVFA
ncbi:hypothetical protein FC83_GL002112 [Agrilactobacillus composti DSM 18527 = JCM 14202]|uniref:Acyltransferase 3 domain-containing protein n=1 Tax=Agrilactobacillus composti DSM 18527 = JCM 14202 TaxID=1423734 RepID=A0A0R1Y111_9LACO|nr:hypothetical protein FC83_GL002112 [Agrilactobacillus composti DSM 18527 = JCM 14202]